MINIVKDNYRVEVTTKESNNPIVCDHCRSELTFDRSDIKDIQVPLIGTNETCTGKGVICPCCGGKIIIG